MLCVSNQQAHTAFLDAEVGQKFLRLVFIEVGQLTFNLGADDHRFAAVMFTAVSAHGLHMRVAVGRGQIAVLDIGGKDGWLGGEQK